MSIHRRHTKHQQASAQFALMAAQFAVDNKLTVAEMATIIADDLARWNWILLRVERHGRKSDKKACEA